MVKLGKKKNIFWEAALLTLVIFIFGIFIGIAFEANKIDQINEYYATSEISLMDIFAFNSMTEVDDLNCNVLIQANLDFADAVYEEAFLLEKYEDSGKLSDNFRIAHKKYDVLRTLLWINSIKTTQKCEGDFSTVIYLYEYEPEDLAKKATQNVWSKILFDLKQEKGSEILLIPIAVDSDLVSLNARINELGITDFPVVVIDDIHIIDEISSVADLGKYL